MTRPVRSLVGLRPVFGSANLWIGTLDNGAEVEVSERLLKLAAAERKPVAVAPLTTRSEREPAQGRAHPPAHAVAYEDEAPKRVRGKGRGRIQCSYCDGYDHNLKTCPKLVNATPEEKAAARTQAYEKSRSGWAHRRRRLAAGATASNSGDGA
jgi:hypothetical protein